MDESLVSLFILISTREAAFTGNTKNSEKPGYVADHLLHMEEVRLPKEAGDGRIA